MVYYSKTFSPFFLHFVWISLFCEVLTMRLNNNDNRIIINRFSILFSFLLIQSIDAEEDSDGDVVVVSHMACSFHFLRYEPSHPSDPIFFIRHASSHIVGRFTRILLRGEDQSTPQKSAKKRHFQIPRNVQHTIR